MVSVSNGQVSVSVLVSDDEVSVSVSDDEVSVSDDEVSVSDDEVSVSDDEVSVSDDEAETTSLSLTILKLFLNVVYLPPEVDACLTNPCQNDATCMTYGPTFQCNCKPGYMGALCETGRDKQTIKYSQTIKYDPQYD